MTPRPGARLAVLLVDDEPATLRAYSRFLRRHDLRTATGLLSASAILGDGFEPDVVICDYDLGSATGLDVLEAVKQLVPGARRLLITVSPERVPEKRAAEVADEVIDKLSPRLMALLASI